MIIYKILKHDKKEFIYIADHPDNYGYICSMLAVTFSSIAHTINANYKNKSISVKGIDKLTCEPNDIINLLLGFDINNPAKIVSMKYTNTIDIALAYATALNKAHSGTWNIFEKLNVIDTVVP